MFIFGSFGQGTAGFKSDIDLFIVGDVDENTLIPLIHKNELVINREINYVLMHIDEFRKRKKAQDPFVTNVMKDPKILITGACVD
jgi:predicted nucleotidyltransferase